MEREKEHLLSYTKVRSRVTSCLFAKNHSHGFLRGLVMGMIFAMYMAQLTAYHLLNQSIKDGELPWYTVDALIMGISIVEVITAPFISWLGYRRRRTMMMIWKMLPAVMILLMLAIPNTPTRTGSDLCNANSPFVPLGITTEAIIKIFIISVVCLTCSLSILGVWSHGIAYMSEHTTEGMSIHFGILFAARILGLHLLPRVIPPNLALWIQVLGICIPLVVHILQLLKVPEQAPPAEDAPLIPSEGRGFGTSMIRVVSNPVAMGQIFAMAFLGAALWGFGWHESDVIRVQYLTGYMSNFTSIYSDIVRYHVPILIVAFVASKFSKPVMATFDSLSGVKLAMVVTILTVPLYVVMVTVFRCTHGNVEGLVGNNYTQPACSIGCGCSEPFNSFSPVCVVDQMTTYLSPCHAGCSRSEDFAGISSLSNCTCGAVSGRATIGACAATSCSSSFELHKLVYVVVVSMTVLVAQAQGVVVMRAVDPRDRSMVLGVLFGTIALVVFVGGHLVFLAIRGWTCAWFEAGRCQLHNSLFPYLVGGTSSLFALVSAIITVVTFCRMRRRGEQKVDLSRESDIEL